MQMTEQKITYEQVEKIASNMLTASVKPTVRGVISITGGRTETVSGFLRDFFNKRDAEVSKMESELGSSKIAKLLASEIQLVVDRKTTRLSEIVNRQKSQLAESIELLDEKEVDCQERIKLAEELNIQSVNEITAKFKHISAEVTVVEIAKNKAESEAESLVKSANFQLKKTESESAELREQVKLLTVDVAKFEIKHSQHEQAQKQLDIVQLSIAEQNILIAQLQTEKTAFTKANSRLESELQEFKIKAEKLSQVQTQLVEVQKQISQLQHELSLTQRERESLSQALNAR